MKNFTKEEIEILLDCILFYIDQLEGAVEDEKIEEWKALKEKVEHLL